MGIRNLAEASGGAPSRFEEDDIAALRREGDGIVLVLDELVAAVEGGRAAGPAAAETASRLLSEARDADHPFAEHRIALLEALSGFLEAQARRFPEVPKSS